MLHLTIQVTVNLSSRSDVQNVPVDTKNVSPKLLVLLVKHLSWCIRKSLNLTPGAP